MDYDEAAERNDERQNRGDEIHHFTACGLTAAHEPVA
jgi:hypothetical protein